MTHSRTYGPSELTALIDETVGRVDDYKVLEIYDTSSVLAGVNVFPEAESLETGALEAGEITFDSGIEGTLEQLIALISAKQEEKFAQTLEPYEIFAEDTAISLQLETNEHTEINNTFQELLSQELKPDTIPPIETIISSADGQTLEETLVQLSFYLAENSEDVKSRPIEDAIKDVAEVLPPGKLDFVGTKIKEIITPELTQRLLILLKTVGYANPQEVLIKFTEQGNFELLLQAIYYLYQLRDSSNQQEFLLRKQLTFSPMNSAEPLTSRLGKTIVRYFFLYKTAADLQN